MGIGKSGEDYLEAIFVLQKRKGSVRSVDVAHHLNYSKPSVSHAVKELKKSGHVQVAEDGLLSLTEAGRKTAERVYERHCFFMEQLISIGVSPETAEMEACQMEHVISEESFQKLKESYKKVIKNEKI